MQTAQKNREWHAWSEQDLAGIASEILRIYGENTVFLLYGPMGVGKSTFVRAFLSVLIPDFSSRGSPTFPVMQEYRMATGAARAGAGGAVYHLDLYRIKHEIELEDAGIVSQLWESPGLTFIEWPEIAPELCAALRRAPPGFASGEGVVVDLEISFGENGSRVFRVKS